jgi:hypothetical protein
MMSLYVIFNIVEVRCHLRHNNGGGTNLHAVHRNHLHTNSHPVQQSSTSSMHEVKTIIPPTRNVKIRKNTFREQNQKCENTANNCTIA